MMVRSAGLGRYPGEQCYDPDRPSWLPYWINTPTELACGAKAVASNVAEFEKVTGSPEEFYQWAQYGKVPEITHVPSLVCPPGSQSIDPFAPDFCGPEVAGEYGQQVHEEEIRKAIEEAEKSGAWNPRGGGLPLTAEWLDKYKWPLLLAGGGVLLLVLLRR